MKETAFKRVFGNPIICFILLAFSILSITGQLNAQVKKAEAPPLRERFFFGGSFGLQLGTYTNIELNPIVGLWVLPRLAVAAGPGYEFFKYRDISTDIFSGRGYTQLVLLRDIDRILPLGVHTSIIFHAEDELLSLDSKDWNNTSVTSKRFQVNTVLLGGGVSQQIGRRGSVNILVLWAMNESGYDLYNNPEIRIGFTF